MDWILNHFWLVPAIPFTSFWLILLFGRRLPGKGAELGVAALGATWVLAAWSAVAWVHRPATGEGKDAIRGAIEHSYTWWSNGQFKITFGFHADGLAVMMLVVVATISLLVHVYSIEYMRGDVRFTHFFAALSLFTCGMYVLVTASSTLQGLFGWEAMGVCSFMLIGHWWEDKANSDAALKAFFTTRTGDVGLLVGISILYFAAHNTFNWASLNAQALSGKIDHTLVFWGAIALMCAVIGKSAQFPLHTWLPDAMAGPTPVSALIHAATMVVAGVYLVARTYGVFWAAFSIGPGTHAHHGVNILAVVGAVTIIIAALLAFVQDDIKKVLAYSTVSQLGYMVMALACGAWVGGIFHLFTHAFFKACLFLGAGSVSHSGSHHSFDMKKDMGGLRKYMPTTFTTFVIASAALAGIFPLAGFWSKDEILLSSGRNGYWAFTIVGIIGAMLTAAYMTRCIYLTFFGEYRGHGHPHESPKLITVPLVILAVLSVSAGWLNAFGLHYFADWTRNEVFVTAHVRDYPFSVLWAGIALGGAIVAAAFAGYFYVREEFFFKGATTRSALAKTGHEVLLNKYFLDYLYTDVIVGGIAGPIARGAYWFNQNVIDAVVNGVAYTSRKVARVVYSGIDQLVVDGAVNGVGAGAEEGGVALRTLQNGRVQFYAGMLFAAAALLGLGLVLFV
ncbi:MAG TPA: NADH-quinone oxidoreductase subunit L [Acidimicrobiales bacterium]|nr:NADH-quinone oxidoreductase subunit L [Acidimicrobiales bacterium]